MTAKDIDTLVASAPPRRVPAQVRAEAWGGSRSWVVPLFGLTVGAFGLPFVWLFFPWGFWNDWRLSLGESVEVSGVVRSVEETGLRHGGSSDHRGKNRSAEGTPIYAFDFEFKDHGGARMAGRCYANGVRWREGDSVRVEYLATDATRARIVGGRLSRTPGTSALVLVIPLVGFAVVAWTLKFRWSLRALLERGQVAQVKVISVGGEDARGRPKFEVVLAGPRLNRGEPLVVTGLAIREIDVARGCLLEGRSLTIIFDPQKETRMLFPDALRRQSG